MMVSPPYQEEGCAVADQKPTIKYYPVCNGDMSLITLADAATLLIDCNIRESSKGDDDPSMFDVKADLMKSIRKNGKIPYVDIFMLTHGDDDHCHGFEKNFYTGDPKSYTDTNAKNDEIRIDVLWFTPMALEDCGNEDAKAFRKEAKRRIKLHNDDHADKDLPGNKIVIIGNNGSEELSDLHTVRYVPGQVVTKFNDVERADFSVFIHAPYKHQLQQADDKNHTSLVVQARFINAASTDGFSCLAMFGGDADHYAWKIILDKTKKYKNDTKEKALRWDLFLAPHHCSWTYFNDHSQKDHPDPVASSLEILDGKRAGAKVIASSKEIKNNDDNPPNHFAKAQYVKKVTDANFLNTEKYDVQGKTPQPIVFEISSQGPVKPKALEGSAKAAGGIATTVIKAKSEYGSQNI